MELWICTSTEESGTSIPSFPNQKLKFSFLAGKIGACVLLKKTPNENPKTGENIKYHHQQIPMFSRRNSAGLDSRRPVGYQPITAMV